MDKSPKGFRENLQSLYLLRGAMIMNMKLTNQLEREEINQIELWKDLLFGNDLPYLQKAVRCMAWKEKEKGQKYAVEEFLSDIILFVYNDLSSEDEDIGTLTQMNKEFDLMSMFLKNGNIDIKKEICSLFRENGYIVGDGIWTPMVVLKGFLKPTKTMRNLMKKGSYRFEEAFSGVIWDLEASGVDWTLADIDNVLSKNKTPDNSSSYVSEVWREEIKKVYKKRIPNVFWNSLVFCNVTKKDVIEKDVLDAMVKFLDGINTKELLSCAKSLSRPMAMNRLLCFLVYIFGKDAPFYAEQLSRNDNWGHNMLQTMSSGYNHGLKDFEIHKRLFHRFGRKYKVDLMTRIGYGGDLHQVLTEEKIETVTLDELDNLFTFSSFSGFSGFCNKFEDEELAEKLMDAHENSRLCFSPIMKKVSEVTTASGPFSCSVLKKNDPIGFALGAITNCCQRPGGAAETCVFLGYMEPDSGFLVFKENEEIFGQGWIYVVHDGEKKTLIIDNIETFEDNRYQKVINDLLIGFCRQIIDIGIQDVQLGLGYNGNVFSSREYVSHEEFKYPAFVSSEEYYTDADEYRMWIMKDGTCVLHGMSTKERRGKKENQQEGEAMPTLGDLFLEKGVA